MAVKFKTCIQCGNLKSTDSFRAYYNGSGGTYTRCKECEKINSRYKYLLKKPEDKRTAADNTELDAIVTLRNLQLKAGLQPPRIGSRSGQEPSVVLEQIDKLTVKYGATDMPAGSVTTPKAITDWLEQARSLQLVGTPEYYINEVYEGLKKTYMPVVGIDQETLIPTYDTTHKEALDELLELFYDYEENYYGEST